MPDKSLDRHSPVKIFCDGLERTVSPGETIAISPGSSITIPPKLYHIFWAAEEGGDLICGEVSSINNDYTDNHHLEEVVRYINLDEDEEPEFLLCNEYKKYLS
jgi:hypothetical protein